MAGSLLFLNKINYLELALKTVIEKPRHDRILRWLLYHATNDDVKCEFGINHLADFVATADKKHMRHILKQIKQYDNKPLEILANMINSKYITNEHKKAILNILKENLTEKQFNSINSEVIT